MTAYESNKEARFQLSDSDLDTTPEERQRAKTESLKAKQKEKLREENMIISLQNFFTKEQAYSLVKYFYHTPSQSTSDFGHSYDLSALKDAEKEFLAKEVKGKNIIELGNNGYYAGHNVPSSELLRLGAKNYVGCDPKYNADGLTFLLNQPDESAVVCSFGVLEEGVLSVFGCGEIENLLSKYRSELGKQIYRVTPKNGITIHGLDSPNCLLSAGFEKDLDIPANLREMGFGKIGVLRKK